MRIASLVPSGTDIVRALGLDDELVGVTYRCEARGKPVLVRPRRSLEHLSQAEIDAASGAMARETKSPYVVDGSLLTDLAPDVVLVQDTCPVCALPAGEGRRAVGDCARVVSLDPHRLEDVLGSVQAVADACGAGERGAALVADLRHRIAEVAARCRGRTRVRVACLEWMDPPWNSGHWVPDLVDLAGGLDVLAVPGRYSERLSWDQVRAARPEVTVLMPCGLDQKRTLRDAQALDLDGLGEVWAAAGGLLFSKPSPGLIDGLQTLGALLHPDGAPPVRWPAALVGGSRRAAAG